MDWNDIRNQVSQISLYDVKAGIRKVQNAVMNYTEMEAKVREATNNEPWGASSTLMQEIANGTFNYQLLNEIMPMIYKRFTEKSAEEWRQIYKALQLMEFLVKNGSERVIDDARSHLSLLKMLRQFHYIDQNGKDQGLNVRNRSQELTNLLSDVEKIRAERKKARATRNKYSGHEGGATFGLGGESERYGGFGSESAGTGSYGGQTRGVYGDGGGFGGEGGDEEYDESGRTGGADRFEEYNEYDDGGAQATPARRKADAPSSSSKRTPKKAEAPKLKQPEVDLFDFGDEPVATTMPSNGAAGGSLTLAPPSSAPAVGGEDDDFDDFQSATPSTTTSALPAALSIPKPNYSSIPSLTAAPPSTQQPSGFSSLISSPPSTGLSTPSSFASPPLTYQQQPKPSGYQPTGPNYFTSVSTSTSPQPANLPSNLGSSSTTTTTAKKPASGDAFASLLGGAAAGKKPAQQNKGLTIADMAKLKSQAGLYGVDAPAAPAVGGSKGTGSGGLDDLLG